MTNGAGNYEDRALTFPRTSLRVELEPQWKPTLIKPGAELWILDAEDKFWCGLLFSAISSSSSGHSIWQRHSFIITRLEHVKDLGRLSKLYKSFTLWSCNRIGVIRWHPDFKTSSSATTMSSLPSFPFPPSLPFSLNVRIAHIVYTGLIVDRRKWRYGCEHGTLQWMRYDTNRLSWSIHTIQYMHIAAWKYGNRCHSRQLSRTTSFDRIADSLSC